MGVLTHELFPSNIYCAPQLHLTVYHKLGDQRTTWSKQRSHSTRLTGRISSTPLQKERSTISEQHIFPFHQDVIRQSLKTSLDPAEDLTLCQNRQSIHGGDEIEASTGKRPQDRPTHRPAGRRRAGRAGQGEEPPARVS
jgi:hypothetical protein